MSVLEGAKPSAYKVQSTFARATSGASALQRRCCEQQGGSYAARTIKSATRLLKAAGSGSLPPSASNAWP